MTEATPLSWPAGWPRTPIHSRQDSRSRFARPRMGINGNSAFWTFAAARDALYEELKRLGAGGPPIVSTNFAVDRYNVPVEGRRRPDDEGVAIYFTLKGKPMVMACDMHLRAEENMRSLALSIDAMRALERHGGGIMMNRAFDGFAALPAPGVAPSWWIVLDVARTATRAQVNDAFRRLSNMRHPDKPGGSERAMAELSEARVAALKEVR